MPAYLHQPVLLSEVIGALNINADGIYVDCTFGRGGHSSEILRNLGANGRILAVDQDSQAVTYGENLFVNESRIVIEQQNFSQISQLVQKHCLGKKVNGILFDLGVSSPQLDDPQRGFGFIQDGQLDMRMNVNTGISAMEWLQLVSARELEKVIRVYGEERYAKKIAAAILRQRRVKPLKTTKQLAAIVQQTVDRSRGYKHPATRTFQAIRIFINKELEVLATTLDSCVELLTQSGRLLIITFHSLEDQLVRILLRKHSQSGFPRKLPAVGHFEPKLIKVCKPIKPSGREIKENPRARSAKLHVMERVGC